MARVARLPDAFRESGAARALLGDSLAPRPEHRCAISCWVMRSSAPAMRL